MADDILLKGMGSSGMLNLKLQQDLQQAGMLQTAGLKKQGTKADPESDKAIESAAQQFEGMLMKQMLQSMWNTVPKDGMLSGSNEESHFRDMLHEAYAEDLSKGQGLGIKELIVREMKRRQEG